MVWITPIQKNFLWNGKETASPAIPSVAHLLRLFLVLEYFTNARLPLRNQCQRLKFRKIRPELLAVPFIYKPDVKKWFKFCWNIWLIFFSSVDLSFILCEGLHSTVSATHVTAVSQIAGNNEKTLISGGFFVQKKTAYRY